MRCNAVVYFTCGGHFLLEYRGEYYRGEGRGQICEEKRKRSESEREEFFRFILFYLEFWKSDSKRCRGETFEFGGDLEFDFHEFRN
jgi:hypothetical protein